MGVSPNWPGKKEVKKRVSKGRHNIFWYKEY
jgi:hypothetical protein